jgi:O-antigen/teichoic acid export membrane protein
MLMREGLTGSGTVSPISEGRSVEVARLSGDAGQPLTHRAVKAGVWNFFLRGVVRGAGFLRNVIFARLLAPSDIGQFGIALVILSLVDRFSRSGIQTALIQKEDSIEEYLDTGWTVQMLRTTALAITCLAAAPWVAAFFGDPLAGPLVRGLAVYLFVNGLASPAMLLLRRSLEFQRQFLIRSSATIANLVVSVIAALALKSAWALMIGLISSAVATVVVSYIVFPYRPKFRINHDQLRELSTFGRWIFVNNILFFLAYRGDNLVVGKLIGTTALGVYLLAYSISEAATVEISKMMTEVAMPAYSRAQGSIDRVRRGFLTASELVLSVTAPVAVVLVVLARPITEVVLGNRWLAVATVLPPLAMAGPLRCFNSNAATVFTGMGRPDLTFRQNLVGVIATYIVMFPLAARFGLVGVGMAVFVGMLATLPFAILHIRRLLELRLTQLLAPFIPALVLSFAVFLSIVATLVAVSGSALLESALAACFAALAYAGTAWILWRRYESGPLRVRDLMRAKRAGRARRGAEAIPAGALP